MYSKQLINFIKRLNTPCKDINKLIQKECFTIERKGYGTPELEMKFLHKIFLQIQGDHPEFKSFSWLQCNAYNDNYYHFNLTSMTVNDYLVVESDIDFYFAYHESDEITDDISFEIYKFPCPEEIKFAQENNFPFDKNGIAPKGWEAYMEYIKKKYNHLETPCLKFLVLLKVMEIHFSMYYFIYTFGNSVKIEFNKEGVIVTKIDLNETDGSPLGEGMHLDRL